MEKYFDRAVSCDTIFSDLWQTNWWSNQIAWTDKEDLTVYVDERFSS